MILSSMWFQKLIRTFFFGIDKIIFNFIPLVYDFLIKLARTSILTQSDILDMANRIYELLTVFMVFKVTFSLIMYVVNPDDFTDKNKGLSKLGTNVIISLSLLILTPYLFNYAYQLQTYILEDNALATLVLGNKATDDSNSPFNTAGDTMAYTVMTPFFMPDSSLDGLYNCGQLTIRGENGEEFNELCSGLSNDDYEPNGNQEVTEENGMKAATLYSKINEDGDYNFQTLRNYVAGVNVKNLGLMFRQNMALATTKIDDEEVFVIEYKYIISTCVGVITLFLLITFCMDVALRSIKLAFLQLIAPIPIISYVDPKSGKDGLFKKWYQMCFKTFLSLFVRLLALYFAVYVISRIDGLVDIIDGSYKSDALLKIFVVIGALMFAKQLPKILEGLGIKLDGDGKFTLNPFKKLENEALGGKRVMGAVGGAAAGIVNGNGLRGAIRGFNSNAGLRGGFNRQASVNRKMLEARMNGAGRFRTAAAGMVSAFGMENADLAGRVRTLNKNKHRIDLAKRALDMKTQEKENRKKELQDQVAPDNLRAKRKKEVATKGKALVDFSKSEITSGKAGNISTKSKYLHDIDDYLRNNQNKAAEADTWYYAKGANGKLEAIKITKGDMITPQMATAASEAVGFYEGKQGALEHLDVRLNGMAGRKAKMITDAAGLTDFERDASGNIVYEDMTSSEKDKYAGDHDDFKQQYEDYEATALAHGETINDTATTIKSQSDALTNEAARIETDHIDENTEIADLEAEISSIREHEKIVYKGKEMTIAEAERIVAEEEKKINDIRTARKYNVDAAQGRRLGPPPK